MEVPPTLDAAKAVEAWGFEGVGLGCYSKGGRLLERDSLL